MARTWILTGSPENHAATREHGFSVLGLKERNRNVDPDPWPLPTSPELVLEESDWIPAESLADQLELVTKWPREHWTPAFQGQIHPVSEHDGEILRARMSSAAMSPAGVRG